jgi:cell division septation protein DedD
MNNADFHRDRPSLQLLGKEFIIVVVVVFSALSFTLGYFVGKSGIEKKPENLSQAAEMTPLPQKQEAETLPQPQNIPIAENTSRTEETAKQNMQPRQKESAEKPAVKEGPVSPQATGSKGPEEPVYTVQFGAFKSSTEAETFRKKHVQKGLKTYITTSTNKKHEKIYKVKTGDFKDRKSAEVLSLKLNKTEQLKTFVTLINE